MLKTADNVVLTRGAPLKKDELECLNFFYQRVKTAMFSALNHNIRRSNSQSARMVGRRGRARAAAAKASAVAAAAAAATARRITKEDIARIWGNARGVHVFSSETDAAHAQPTRDAAKSPAAEITGGDEIARDKEQELDRLYSTYRWRVLLDRYGNEIFLKTADCKRLDTWRNIRTGVEPLHTLPPDVDKADVVGKGVCVRCLTRRSEFTCRGCAATHRAVEDEKMRVEQNRLEARQRARKLQERLRALPTTADDITPGAVLPLDVLLLVFSTFGLNDLGRCSQVCRLWYVVSVRTASVEDRAEELLLPAVLRALPHCNSLSSDLGVPFVHRLTRFRGQLPDSALPALLESCPFVTDLDITGLSAAGLRSLCASHHWTASIRRLSILNYVEPSIIQLILSGFKNLEHLLVGTDSDVAPSFYDASQLRSLRSLGLIDFSNKFGAALHSFGALFAEADGETVKRSTAFPTLRHLTLIGPKEGEVHCLRLGQQIPNQLQSCEIRHAQLASEGDVARIVKSNALTLKKFALDGCSIPSRPTIANEMFIELSQCKQLSSLRLPCTLLKSLSAESLAQPLETLCGSLAQLSIEGVDSFSGLVSLIALPISVGGKVRELRVDVSSRCPGGTIDGDSATRFLSPLLTPSLWPNLDVLDLNHGCLDDKAWSEIIIGGGLNTAPMLRFFSAAVGSPSGAMSALACIAQAVEFAPRRIQCIILYDSDNSRHQHPSSSDISMVDESQNLTIHLLEAGVTNSQTYFDGDPLAFLRGASTLQHTTRYYDIQACSSCNDVLHREHQFPRAAAAVTTFMQTFFPTHKRADDTLLIRQQKVNKWESKYSDSQLLFIRADCALVRTGIADDSTGM